LGFGVIERQKSNKSGSNIIQNVVKEVLSNNINHSVVVDFIKLGGIELLDKSIKEHGADDFLRQQIPILRKDIIGNSY